MSDIEQGSAAWHEMRLGKVTASRVSDVVAKTKSGPSASRATYMAQLIAERLTGEVAETYVSAAMQHGTDNEADARLAYAFRANAEIEEIAFVPHPVIAMTGASPDGLVAPDGLVEIKAPNTATHIDTLRNAAVPGKYQIQMQWQMACTGRLWCDFVSFDPRLPESMQLFVQRVGRDDAHILELEREVLAFLTELDETVSELIRQYGLPLAA